MTTPTIDCKPGSLIDLEGDDYWPKSVHVFDEKSLWALNAAFATGRPLLLRGEPGTGKSQLARAAAAVLGWPLLSKVVNARMEPEDLLYRFDAVARLATAQVMTGEGDRDEKLEPRNFLLPEILWWAFDSDTARAQQEVAGKNCGSGERRIWGGRDTAVCGSDRRDRQGGFRGAEQPSRSAFRMWVPAPIWRGEGEPERRE